MTETTKRYDTLGGIMAYENGELDETETIELFQHLVNTGMAWQLQGHYGRTAADLIGAGLVQPNNLPAGMAHRISAHNVARGA